MAFNLNALKGLFSKLKPAAKVAANYSDDVAGAIANYGDDAAKALTAYGDDVASAVSSADDLVRRGLAPANKQTATGDALEALYRYQIDSGAPVLAPDDVLDDMYMASSGNSYVAHSDPNLGIKLYTPGTESDDYLRKFGESDWTLNTDQWGRQHPIRKQDLVDDSFLQFDPGVRQSGLPATAAGQSELIDALNNPDIMDSLDTALYYGDDISNFDNTSSYVDQLLHPTPNWTSRFGNVDAEDVRLKNLHKQLTQQYDTWKNFQDTFGHTPAHVNLDDLSDQMSRLRRLRDRFDFGNAGFE